MKAILLDGKALKAKKFIALKNQVEVLKTKKIIPHLAVIIVGENAASKIYVSHKEKACAELGIKSTVLNFSKTTNFIDLKKQIEKLNTDKNVHGILVQLPLPKHMNSDDVVLLIDPKKDVDGLHPLNQGINFTRTKVFAPIPCTANGIMELLKEYKVSVEGKEVLVIGRSNIVGRPVSYLLANANATVLMAHSHTSEESLKRLTKNADIIILATGVKDLIVPSMVKKGAIIIDVGIIRQDDGKLRGDILYQKFINRTSYITPVPGGVGPMTITMLMENIIKLATKNKDKV